MSRASNAGKGYYTVENLQDGDYTVNVTATGFSSLIIANLHLDPGTPATFWNVNSCRGGNLRAYHRAKRIRDASQLEFTLRRSRHTPNIVGALIRSGGSGKKAIGQKSLYNYSAFAVPAWGTFGNSQPGVLRGPKEVSFATAVNKTFPITERAGLQLRAEAFNIFNHPNINSINSTFSFAAATNASSFGYAATAGDMRQMEFSARLNF